MPATLVDDPTGLIGLDRRDRERRLRLAVPPPRDPVAREQYERELAEWLDTPEWERDALGFGEVMVGCDPSLSF